jgi:energy-coupling factor transporter ATP-binding protein EcfA2
MRSGYENFFSRSWNNLIRAREKPSSDALRLGHLIEGEKALPQKLTLPHGKRPEHLCILGKTGSGKSSLLRYICKQDIEAGHGFIFFDLHGDSTPHLLSLVASVEKAQGLDLSDRLVLIDPSDRSRAAGLNILEAADEQDQYVQVAEIVQILKNRWQLEVFGARTEELLRNALLVLMQSGFTLLELPPLLTSAAFRAYCLTKTRNPEARAYFLTRYGRLSPSMQAVVREAVLNKITAFTADPHFRHLIGQSAPRFDLKNAIDGGQWIIINLEVGRLGAEAETLGALLLSRIKHALFARRSRRLVTLFCDELQRLLTFDTSLDTLFSEARKFGVSVVSANQYLDQYPPAMQAALLAVGTQIYFQLSSLDANLIAGLLGGGRALTQTLQNLPPRECLVRTEDTYRRARVPEVRRNPIDFRRLKARSEQRFARERRDVEEEIEERWKLKGGGKEVLDGWT